MAAKQQQSIKQAKLSSLSPDPMNANKGTERGTKMLEDSLFNYGAGRSVLADKNLKLIAGNKTVEGAASIGMDDVLIVPTDGKRLVVVQRTDLDLDTDATAKELAIADNRIGQVSLDFDAGMLQQLSTEIDLSKFWRPDELEAMFGEVNSAARSNEIADADASADLDRAKALLEKWKCKAGNLWTIGEHRLLCGDSTVPKDVGRLMNGRIAAAVLTDTPYGINREGIANDDEQGLPKLFEGILKSLPVTDAVIVCFQSPRLFPIWLDAVRAHGHKFERMLWMYKSNDETFPWRGWLLKSEAIVVSSVGKGQWQDIHPYSHDTYTPTSMGKELGKDEGWHASVKSLEVVTDLLKRICPEQGTVYDPCAGSGTIAIAAEQAKCAAYMMEIAPEYCAVILERLSNIGLEPKLAK